MESMDDLIKRLGLENATTEEKNKVLIKLTESLLKRLLARVYENLTEEQQGELERFVAASDEKGLNDFLLRTVPNLDAIRQEEFENLIKELENFAATAEGK